MRKEVLYAIIFGIILGGIILYGINLANKSVSPAPESTNTKNTDTSPTPTPTNSSLSIIFPQDHTVTGDKTTTLSGKAIPGSSIAISSESDDLIIETSPEGTFSAQINLVSGENNILVTELLKDNTTVSQTISVIQSNNLPE